MIFLMLNVEDDIHIHQIVCFFTLNLNNQKMQLLFLFQSKKGLNNVCVFMRLTAVRIGC